MIKSIFMLKNMANFREKDQNNHKFNLNPLPCWEQQSSKRWWPDIENSWQSPWGSTSRECNPESRRPTFVWFLPIQILQSKESQENELETIQNPNSSNLTFSTTNTDYLKPRAESSIQQWWVLVSALSSCFCSQSSRLGRGCGLHVETPEAGGKGRSDMMQCGI